MLSDFEKQGTDFVKQALVKQGTKASGKPDAKALASG